MAPAMKSMKARAAMKGGNMTQTEVLKSVAETNGLKTKPAKGVVEALMAVACDHIKMGGNFKLAGMLNMQLKKIPVNLAETGINPFTNETSVFKAKPAPRPLKSVR